MANMLIDLGAVTETWDRTRGKTALMIAVRHRDLPFVRLLLARGEALKRPMAARQH